MIRRCQADCIQAAVVTAYFRVGDPLKPADIDLCRHHGNRHMKAVIDSPSFIVATPLDEDGNAITLDAKDPVA